MATTTRIGDDGTADVAHYRLLARVQVRFARRVTERAPGRGDTSRHAGPGSPAARGGDVTCITLPVHRFSAGSQRLLLPSVRSAAVPPSLASPGAFCMPVHARPRSALLGRPVHADGHGGDRRHTRCTRPRATPRRAASAEGRPSAVDRAGDPHRRASTGRSRSGRRGAGAISSRWCSRRDAPSAASGSAGQRRAEAAARAERRQAPQWVMPVPGAGWSASFGEAGSTWSSGYHTGQDFTAPSGTPVMAAGAGTITSATWSDAYGNMHRDHSPGR